MTGTVPVPEQTVPRRLPRLLDPVVHHTLHGRAEWSHRALVPVAQGGVRLGGTLRRLRRGAPGDRGLDRLVQRRAPDGAARLSQPRRLPGAAGAGGRLSSASWGRPRWRHIAPAAWKLSNRPVAVVRLEPVELRAPYGLRFDEDGDHLGLIRQPWSITPVSRVSFQLA